VLAAASRKASLMVSSSLMMVATTSLRTVVATDAAIGVLRTDRRASHAGLSVGGEFARSPSFLVEHGRARKGLFAGFRWTAQGFAGLLHSSASGSPPR
jgi:hypothetical protein